MFWFFFALVSYHLSLLQLAMNKINFPPVKSVLPMSVMGE